MGLQPDLGAIVGIFNIILYYNGGRIYKITTHYKQIIKPVPSHSTTPITMSIIYAVIARQNPTDHTVLCSYDTAHGNYPTICQQLLKNAKITENKIFNYNNQYNFHVLKDQDLLFVCMAQVAAKTKFVFGFLQDVKKAFLGKYSAEEIRMARDYDMSASFSQIFKSQISTFNTNAPKKDNKDVLMKQLGSLQQVMSQNIDKVLQNEQRVKLIVKKAEKTHTIADEIKLSASKLRKDAFFKRHKYKILVLVLLVGVAIGVYFLV